MAEVFKAMVTNKETNQTEIIESEYASMGLFIADLRRNGYTVSKSKVKLAPVFDYIMENTNCNSWDWQQYNTLADIAW